MLTKRNYTIDMFRGLGMMYVIFIHCIYWTGVYPIGYAAIFKSLFLIEMPLFFVITGASNYLSKTVTLKAFYFSRLKRILIPYWFYATICIIFTYAIVYLRPKLIISEELWRVILSWVVPLDRQITNLPFVCSALWFVPVYLMVIIVFPLLKNIFNHLKSLRSNVIVLIAFSVSICALSFVSNNGNDILYYIKSVLFYCFWCYVGMIYMVYFAKKTVAIKSICSLIGFCGIGVFFFVFALEFSPNMQSNKFPPNIVMLLYSLGALIVCYHLIPKIEQILSYLCKNKVFDWIFQVYKDSCYTVFLYHPFAFIFANVVFSALGLDSFLNAIPLFKIVLYLLTVIPISAVLGKLFTKIETIR